MSVYRGIRSYRDFLLVIVILLITAYVAYRPLATRLQTWLTVLVLMILFALAVGHGITGYWRGVLIDSRNRMTLSRLQFLAWTVVILSAILTAVMTNGAYGAAAPMDLEIPNQLLILMGISGASLVGSPAALSTKRDKQPQDKEEQATAAALASTQTSTVDTHESSVVVRFTDAAHARWGDLLKGDETGNAASVDLGKMQMFLFTFVLILGYCSNIASMLGTAAPVTQLPAVDEGMNTLLGISHTGYLTNKFVPHSKEKKPAAQGPAAQAP